MLTVGSLFSGVGGFDLGLERAGFSVRWQCEIDPFRRRILAKHWPDAERFGDIRELAGEDLARVDVICGGFPCPDISTAGLRAGITGIRSGLWREMVRTIRLVRPRYAIVENVAALLHRGMDTVLGDLAASGYDAEWDCLPAVAFGATHERDRVFIVAHANESDGQAGLGNQSVRQKSVFPADYEQRPRIWVEAASGCARSDDGLPLRLYRPRVEAIGDAVFVPIAEWLGKRIVAIAGDAPLLAGIEATG